MKLFANLVDQSLQLKIKARKNDMIYRICKHT